MILSSSGKVIRSRWWFLLPITLQLLGGIIAYFALRQDDPPKAKNCLMLGAVLTAFGTVVIAMPLILLFAFGTPVQDESMWIIPPDEFAPASPSHGI